MRYLNILLIALTLIACNSVNDDYIVINGSEVAPNHDEPKGQAVNEPIDNGLVEAIKSLRAPIFTSDDPMDYVHNFVEVAKENDVDLSYIYDHRIEIILKDIETVGVGGRAYGIYKDDIIYIEIDEPYWSTLHDLGKMQLMYHELGHDILNYVHGHDGISDDGIEIMHQSHHRHIQNYEQFDIDVIDMFNHYKNN